MFLICKSRVIYVLETIVNSLITVAISLWTAENLDFNYERITEVNDSIPIIDAKAELCVTSGHADYSEIEEYHVGVKYGMILYFCQKCKIIVTITVVIHLLTNNE